MAQKITSKTEIAENDYQYFWAASDELLNDVDLCRMAVDKRSSNIAHVPDTSPLKNDKAYCIKVISEWPSALLHMKNFNDDPSIVELAVKTYKTALIDDTGERDYLDVYYFGASKRIKAIIGDGDPEKGLATMVLEQKLQHKLSPKIEPRTKTMKI